MSPDRCSSDDEPDNANIRNRHVDFNGVNNNNDYHKTRLRRTKSVSKAESVTDWERLARDKQPDRPIHLPRDSLFTWTSGFSHYEGIINWGAFMLVLGGLRLCLENIIKYGIRVNPFNWIAWMMEQQKRDNILNAPIFLLLSNGHFIFTLIIEKLLAKDKLGEMQGRMIHIVHLSIIVFIPFIVLGAYKDSFSLAGRTIICFIYTVMFLKIWSYAQVNYWCRLEEQWRKRHIRKRSMSFRKNSEKHNHDLDDISENPSADLVKYPHNLSLKDLYYFVVAPTLCYELNFPRNQRIRKRFLVKRVIEIIIMFNILIGLVHQWIIPSVSNSFQAFSDMNYMRCTERLLKLALPNHLLWLLWFYAFFHSFLNIVAELLRFSDRNFYQDWWNARDVGTFWRLWNMPVHRWAVRHIFVPMVKAKYHKGVASLFVFVLSAFFHEYLVSIPLQMYKIFVFLGMLNQVPLLYISHYVAKHVGDRWGNIIVWASLILGQPLGIMVYYHDYVVTNFDVTEINL